MEKAINALKKEFGAIRTGRANPLILDKVVVDYYGVPTPLRQMSQVSVQDGQTLVITPYDKSIIKEIEKAMIKAELGITPNSDGIVIRLTFPPLTEDRRKEISKDVKKIAEEAKVAIRNIRRDMTDDLKKIEKADNLPEDAVKDNQDKIQKITDKYERVAVLEQAYADAIGSDRFIPYIQLHEFEALVFCGIDYLLELYPKCKKHCEQLKSDLDKIGNPELINDNPATAPSKRIIRAIEGNHKTLYNYNKPATGKYITSRVGIEALRSRCHHFDKWVAQLIDCQCNMGQVHHTAFVLE